MSLSQTSYRSIADLVRRHAGIVLGDNKQYLVEARLPAVARNLEIDTLDQLVARAGASPSVLDAVVDAMTTNETSFFRDQHPFETLRTELIPDLIDRRKMQRRLRIWSAACSTGQEALSVAMMLHDNFPSLGSWDVQIVGTDISDTALSQAESGLYSALETTRGLSVALRDRHFDQADNGWRAKPHLRRRISVQKMNLLGRWTAVPRCDLILLRNVLIYFDEATKAQLLKRAHERLAQDGYLLLGGSELPAGRQPEFTRTRVGRTCVYQ